MSDNKNVKKFYNNFKGKLINDFIKPNARVHNAISRSLLRIPLNAKNILDLGFGLGWSSYEFARHFPNAKVDAFDISEDLYKTASQLFQLPNLQYHNLDLTQEFPKGLYDVIILLDVFEHIPSSARQEFHNNIAKVLKPNGRVIMTCPTVAHQNYLRKEKPEGLQPVDEDVDLMALFEFANSIDAEISLFEYLNVWNTNDYLIAEITLCSGQNSHTPNYLSSVSLINFYKKYALLDQHEATRLFLSTLPSKQRVRLFFKKWFGL